MPNLRLKNNDQDVNVTLSKDNFRIGRTAENDLEINSPLVSRRQSSIVRKGERYIVYDLDSSNGTFVNGERIEMKVLEDGDMIRIGDSEITFIDTKETPGTKAGTQVTKKKEEIPSDSEIVQHVEAIAESFAFDISDALKKGVSLREVRKQVSTEKAARESSMFFVLYQIAKQLGTATSVDELLLFAMKLIFDSISCERGAVLLNDAGTGDLEQKLTYHKQKGQIAGKLGISTGIANRALKERVSIITSDALQDPRFMQGMSIVQYNIRSALCVPLWEGDRTYGVIYLDNLAKTYAFTRDDLELLTAIANLVAIRIKQEELNEKLRQEEVLRTNLSKYHSPDVVEHLMAKGGNVELDVDERDVSVLFVDVVGSTPMSEKLGPHRVSAMLNLFFEMATTAIFQYKGHVNKFIGDAVMAIFNAPLDLPAHHTAAVESAVKIMKDIRSHNGRFPNQSFSIRIGINSGTAVAGDVGTPHRKEYTVIGDTVNVAARLVAFPEPMKIVVGPDTYAHVSESFKAKDLGEVVLKGKEKPLRAYEILVE